MALPRIVSLVPAGTDLVAELGLQDGLVGVSHQCDHPSARGKPVVTSTSLPSVGDGGPGRPRPAEVDRAVSTAVQNGQPLYRTDVELLRRLDPDVVVAQGVCDVCAVSGDQVGDGLPPGAELVTLEATSLSGLEDDLERLGKAAGAEDAAGALAAQLWAGVGEVAASVAGRPRRRALVLEWSEPPFLGGHWVPELVERAGGRHLLSSPGQPSRRAGWADVTGAGAEVVVLAPCGYPLAAAVAEARAVRAHLGPGPELWATHATTLFSRCTPAAVLCAVRLLAGVLHPEVATPPDPDLAARV